MKTRKRLGPLSLLASAVALAACGGGSGSGTPQVQTPPSGSPAPVPVAVIGTITGFGSIYVNGIRYDVAANTIVDIEDQNQVLGDDSELRLGMKVRLIGTDDNGQRVASYIAYDDDLRGPIESIAPDPADPSIGSFEVLGLTIIVDGETVFDDDVDDSDGIQGIDLRDLAVGMVVEISGFAVDGGFLATRVDRELDENGDDPEVGRPDVDDDEIEVKGFVESIASDGSSITVNGIDFLIDAATFFDDGLMLNDDLLGMYVEVEADIVGAEFVAREIEREDEFDFDDDDLDDDRDSEFEIEGVLQSVDTASSPNTITIDGMTFSVSDASGFAALVGERVEVEGRFDDAGVLVLREIELDIEDNVETEDLVSMVDVTAGTFTTRLGLTIAPTGASRVEDDYGDDDHITPEEFVNRLQIGDRVEAKGFSADGGPVSWNRIEREEAAGSNGDFECELSGPVQSIDATLGSFVILDVTVSTDRVDEEDFEGPNDESIGRTAFFERLAVGDIVEAESSEGDLHCMPGMLDAEEVEFEDDDD